MSKILRFIESERHARTFLGGPAGDLDSWAGWLSILKAVYGLPIKSRHEKQFIQQVTGRSTRYLPRDGFQTALMLTGRRSGKSRIAATIAAFEAAHGKHEERLAPGEVGFVACVSPTKHQSSICKSYILGLLTSSPVLRKKIVRETKHEIELANGLVIAVLSGDWRSVRGFTLAALILDEVCFLANSEEAKVSDTELVRALQPGLATLGGKLVAISSPYARKGWAYRTWKKNFGNDAGKTLVVNCPSRTLNPTLPQSVVDQALEEDLASAKAEFFAEWRDDVAGFVSRPMVEKCVVESRSWLMPGSHDYWAFADLSGGRNDSAALCIGHREGDVVVLDLLTSWPGPHDPYGVIRDMAEAVKRYGVRSVTGDKYAAEFVTKAFQGNGIRYRNCDLSKSQLYLELLPRIAGCRIELLDQPKLVDQLSSLERRTRSGGRDIVDHPQGGHDDLANAVAGASWLCGRVRRLIGAF